MNPLPGLSLDCFKHVVEHIDLNPAVYARLALVSRSFKQFFLSDQQWRALNPYGLPIGNRNEIASRYLEESNNLRYMGALWSLINCDLWSRVGRTQRDLPYNLPDRATLRIREFFERHQIRNSTSLYVNVAVILCSFGFQIYPDDAWNQVMWMGAQSYPQDALKMVYQYVKNVILDYKWLPNAFATYSLQSERLIRDSLRSLDKEALLVILERYGIAFDFVSRPLRNDCRVILAAMNAEPPRKVRQTQHYLDFVPNTMFTNRRFMLTVASRVDTLEFLNKREPGVDDHIDWAADREFVLAAVKFDGKQLEHAAKRFWNDPEIVLNAIPLPFSILARLYLQRAIFKYRPILVEYMCLRPHYLDFIGEEHHSNYFRDMKVVMAAAEACVSRRPFLAFQYLSPSKKGNRDLVLLAAKTPEAHIQVLPYLKDEHRKDRQIIMEIIRGSFYDLSSASELVRDDKEMVMAAVEKWYLSLCYASERLKKDPEVVLTALRGTDEVHINYEALQYASPDLLNDQGFMAEVMTLNTRCFEYASSEIKNDFEFRFKAIKAAKPGTWRVLLGTGEGADYTNFLVRLAGIGRICDRTPLNLRADPVIMMKAVKYEPWALHFASDELKQDRTLVMEAVKVAGSALNYASELMKNDEEIMLEALKTSSENCPRGNTFRDEIMIKAFKLCTRVHYCHI